MHKIKTIAICFSQIPFFKGGAENLVSSLAEELEKRGYEVELIRIPHEYSPHKKLFEHFAKITLNSQRNEEWLIVYHIILRIKWH
jgi:hypothetical protein